MLIERLERDYTIVFTGTKKDEELINYISKFLLSQYLLNKIEDVNKPTRSVFRQGSFPGEKQKQVGCCLFVISGIPLGKGAKDI